MLSTQYSVLSTQYSVFTTGAHRRALPSRTTTGTCRRMTLGKVRQSGFPSVWAASGYGEDIDAPTAVWHPCARNVCLLKNTGVLDTRRTHNKVKRIVWKLHARSCFLDVSSVAESAAAAAWGQLLRLCWVSCCGCVAELECVL